MFNVGAFAGGLAEGIRSGQEMQIKGRAADRLARAADQEAEMHQFRMDKAAFEKDKRSRLKAANEEIAAGWDEMGQGSTDESVTSQEAGLKDATALEGRRGEIPGSASKSPAFGLMSQYGKSSASRMRAMQQPSAEEAIGRRMLVGDLLENTDELNRMANIYKKHGLLADMLPWMNSAYAAKKKRIPEALQQLVTGDARGARETLRQGGINLADEPVPINPDNPQSYGWKFRLENGDENDIDVRDLAKRFFPGFSSQD